MSLIHQTKQLLPARLMHWLRILKQYYLGRGEPELRALSDFLKQDQACIDVGGNYGIYSYVLARTCKEVLVVEPSRECINYLRKVLPTNAKLLEVGASASNSKATLRIPHISGERLNGWATISPENTFHSADNIKTIDEEPIEIKTLDSLVSEHLPPNTGICFVKIDIEGHELEAVQGAESIIKKFRPVFLIETEYRHGADVGRLFAVFEEFGYSSYYLKSGTQRPISPSELKRRQTANPKNSEASVRSANIGNRNVHIHR